MFLLFARFVVHIVAPIALGGSIYLLWRSDTLLMFRWIEAAGLAEWLSEIRRSPILPPPESLSPALLYSLPDAAWAYSCALFFALLWHDVRYRLAQSLVLLGPACAAGGELGQALGVVPGTFDPLDLLLVSFAACIAYFIFTTWRSSP